MDLGQTNFARLEDSGGYRFKVGVDSLNSRIGSLCSHGGLALLGSKRSSLLRMSNLAKLKGSYQGLEDDQSRQGIIMVLVVSSFTELKGGHYGPKGHQLCQGAITVLKVSSFVNSKVVIMVLRVIGFSRCHYGLIRLIPIY